MMKQSAYPQARPVAAGAPQVRRLAGRIVSEPAFDFVRRCKQANQRVFMTIGSMAEGEAVGGRFEATHCENCDGFGRFAIQVIVAGPFSNVPPYVREKGAGEEGGIMASPAYHNGKWYQMAMNQYECPVCGGSGMRGGDPDEAARQRVRAMRPEDVLI